MYLRTRQEIESNLKIIVPGIKKIFISERSIYAMAVISVKLPWWKWLLPGIIHFIFRRKIERAFYNFGVAGILYVIKVS